MSTKDNYKKAFSAGAKGRTNFLVFGVLAVAIAGAAAIVSKKSSGPSDAAAQVMRAPDGVAGVADANKASEAYLNTLKDSNKQEIDAALENGTSAVATLTAKAVKIDDKPAVVEPTTIVMAQPEKLNPLPEVPQFATPQGAYMPVGQAGAAYSSGAAPSGFEQNKALASQVGELLGSWNAPGQLIYTVRSDEQMVAGAAVQDAAPVNAVPAGGANAEQEKVMLIPAGKTMYAVLETEAVSDDGGPVAASIVSGPYKGARLLGTMTVTRDAARLNFVSLTFKGATAAISAVAVDPDSGRVGMADEVNKRWFEKYGLVFLANFVGKYGEAVGQQRTTVTDTGTATVTQQDPMSPKVRTQVALGGAASGIGQQLGQEASQVKTTVTLHQAKPIGILFLKDVMSQ